MVLRNVSLINVTQRQQKNPRHFSAQCLPLLAQTGIPPSSQVSVYTGHVPPFHQCALLYLCFHKIIGAQLMMYKLLVPNPFF